MPGPVSESYQGPPDDGPYVPSWCYPNNSPRMCPCGHHEGYHADDGSCVQAHRCGCKGLPPESRMPDEEFDAREGVKFITDENGNKGWIIP